MIYNMEDIEKERVVKDIVKGFKALRNAVQKDLEYLEDLQKCEVIPFSHYFNKGVKR
jgi:hypothetical protein